MVMRRNRSFISDHVIAAPTPTPDLKEILRIRIKLRPWRPSFPGAQVIDVRKYFSRAVFRAHEFEFIGLPGNADKETGWQ